MNTATRINDHAAAVKAAAAQIDTSRTEVVDVADLKVGDVITRLGNVTFPFPFTLSKVQGIGGYGFLLLATHGWGTPGPVKATESATRVL